MDTILGIVVCMKKNPYLQSVSELTHAFYAVEVQYYINHKGKAT